MLIYELYQNETRQKLAVNGILLSFYYINLNRLHSTLNGTRPAVMRGNHKNSWISEPRNYWF
jgi:hypothetical protein